MLNGTYAYQFLHHTYIHHILKKKIHRKSVHKRNYFWSDTVEESSKIKFSGFTLSCQMHKIKFRSCLLLKQFHIVSIRTVSSSNIVKCTENTFTPFFTFIVNRICRNEPKKIHKLRKKSLQSWEKNMFQGWHYNMTTFQSIADFFYAYIFWCPHTSLKTSCRTQSLSIKITGNQS